MQVNLGKIFFIQTSSFLWLVFHFGACAPFPPPQDNQALAIL